MKTGFADEIKRNQDKEGMLQRSLERIIQLYTDKSHFVYELLQNAEDAGASSIKFLQYDDRLEVIHDGKPFTKENLQSLCDIGQSDKALNQIGEFGVGFKSVFSICDKVKLFSEPKNYRKNFDAVTQPFAIQINGFVNPEDIEIEAIDGAYTTKFVFPYSYGNSFSGFDSLEALRSALSKKLQNLGITTLLFMKNLQLIEFEINCSSIKTKGEYLLQKEEINDHCFRVSALGSSNFSNDDVVSYLMFSRRIDDDSNRTVDIAFPVKEQEDGEIICVKPQNPYISVYFPTETESKLNFIVQGPYRTTPNRSSIPADNRDNIDLVAETAILLEQSIMEMIESNIFNMSFMKALPLDEDAFYSYDLFLPLYNKVLELSSNERIIPTKSGYYANRAQVRLARQERLTNVLDDKFLTDLINDGKQYYWLPTYLTETNRDYLELYRYLYNTLDITLVRPEDLRILFANNPSFLPAVNNDWLIDLYSVFENIPSVFSKSKGETNMLTANIVKTSSGKFVAPYRKSEGHYIPNVYAPNKHFFSKEINFVDPYIYEKCRHFFDDIIHLQKPDVYEFEISAIKQRYSSKHYEFNEQQHASDFKFLLKHLSNEEHTGEVSEVIKEYFLIKCNDNTMRSPYECNIYLPIGLDETNIEGYYKNIYKNVFFVDMDYYSSYEIAPESVCKMGVKSTVLTGETQTRGIYLSVARGRSPEWHTFGDFRWVLSINKLREALIYISNNPDEQDALIKSQVVLRTLLNNENKLIGDVYIGGNTQDLYNEPCDMLNVLTKSRNFKWDGRWLYTESLELVSPRDISKHDLNSHIYGSLRESSKVYDLLGFKKDKADEVDELKKSITQTQLDLLFENELKHRFGVSPADLEKQYGVSSISTFEDEQKVVLSFPKARVKNWDTLRKHAAEMLVYANPVQYENVVRRIRTSDRSKEARNYLMNMYKYDGTYRYACQLCHDSCSNFEKVQIFNNPDTELDPMNLCMCPNCAAKYKVFRNNTAEMNQFKKSMLSFNEHDVSESDHVVVPLGEHEIWFTQVHFAEIISLLKLKHDVKSYKEHPVDVDDYFEGKSDLIDTGRKITIDKADTVSVSEKKEPVKKKQSGLSVYKEYIGKRIRRKPRKFSKEYDLEGVITDVDEEHIIVRVDKGKDAGEEIKIVLSFIISKKDIYEIY